MIKLKKFYLDICKTNFEVGNIKLNTFYLGGEYVYLTDSFTMIKISLSLYNGIVDSINSKNYFSQERAYIKDDFLSRIYNNQKTYNSNGEERTITITKDAIDKVYAYSKVTKNYNANINNEIVININYLKSVIDMINEPSITVKYYTSANPEDTSISALTITSDTYSNELEVLILPIRCKMENVVKTHTIEV